MLLVSTPVGPLGSGIGGGVELTLHNLVFGLGQAGHHIEVVAPSGSLHIGKRVHQIDGTLQASSQMVGRDAPIEMPTGGVLAAMWSTAAALQDEFDVIMNLGYDWLPVYLTDFFRTPVLHLVSMGSVNDVMDGALAALARRVSGRLGVHSQAQADTFAEPGDFRILGNGIVTERYDLHATVEPTAALGFVGRISPEKGLEDIAALSELTGRAVRVWGMMQDQAYWDRVVAAHPDARLDYQGFLPTDEMQAELGHCAALVMTPKWIEAFGNVAIEAMATGVPVITYDRGGPAEIVLDGVTGFVTPPDDVVALAAAVDRIGTIDRLRCRQRVDAEFSSAAMARRVTEWVADVLSESRSTSFVP